MQIILKKDFKELGYKNETVSVKPGYARNFLIPKRIAIIATEQNMKIAQENVKQAAHKLARHKQEAENIATKLREVKLEIKAKVGEKNKIFGSITPIQIIDLLKEKTGYLADKRDITFDKPARTLGAHQVHIKLHKDVAISLQYEVKPEA
jgi:large subunit ribosomal protein L9